MAILAAPDGGYKYYKARWCHMLRKNDDDDNDDDDDDDDEDDDEDDNDDDDHGYDKL